MQPTIARAARLIQFVGPRKNIWKDSAPHGGKHPLEPANLEKHAAQANPRDAPQQKASSSSSSSASAPAPSSKSSSSSKAIEYGLLPARYKRLPLSEAEMEIIQSGGAF